MKRSAVARGAGLAEEPWAPPRLLGLNWPRLTRVLAAAGLALAYALAATPLVRLFGPVGGAFTVVPTAAAGWLLGPRAGVLTALLLIVVNTLALNLAGQPGWDATLRSGVVPGIVVSLLIGLAAGGQRHLDVRLHQQGAALARQGAALATARAEARAVLDATAEAMVLIDPARRFRLVNRAFTELLGVAPEAVLGRDFRELGPLVARVFADPDGFVRLVADTATDSTRRPSPLGWTARPAPSRSWSAWWPWPRRAPRCRTT